MIEYYSFTDNENGYITSSCILRYVDWRLMCHCESTFALNSESCKKHEKC